MPATTDVFKADSWFEQGRGPRYQQLQRHIAAAIRDGTLAPDDQLPPEREIAEIAEISRITVRKAISQLAADGLIEQKQGAGSFVRSAAPRVQQSLSSLVSFSENIRARGMVPTSAVLERGLFVPSQQEMLALGLSAHQKVARVNRLRSASETPVALEYSSLPDDILARPEQVKTSLYDVLRKTGQAPTRALQRVTAVNAGSREAELLRLPVGTAVLRIERTGFLATGRPIEFTVGLYRSDIYDFVSELRQD